MKNNLITEKSISELIDEIVMKNKFQPVVSESSGLPDDLSDEEIDKVIKELKKCNNSKEKKKY